MVRNVARLFSCRFGSSVRLVNLTRSDAIKNFDGGVRQVTGEQATAGIFATYPAPYLSVLGACIDEVVLSFGNVALSTFAPIEKILVIDALQTAATALLCVGVGTIVDKRNRVPEHLHPAYVGRGLQLLWIWYLFRNYYSTPDAHSHGTRHELWLRNQSRSRLRS